MDEMENLYSDRKLQELVLNASYSGPEESVDAVFNSIVKFRGNAEQSDDITILALNFNQSYL